LNSFFAVMSKDVVNKSNAAAKVHILLVVKKIKQPPRNDKSYVVC